MKFAHAIAIFAGVFAASAAVAQDHLEPEDSVYAGRAFQDEMLIGYDIDVVRKFNELFAGAFDARAIVLPSFETEYGVGITRDTDDPRLVGLRTDAMLWHYSILREYDSRNLPESSRYGEQTKEDMRELRASLPPSIEDVKLKRCEMPLGAEDQAVLTGLWRAMLYGVRYLPTNRLGIDGVSYHYSGIFGFQWLAGQTWSPKSGTLLDRFTRMTESLYAACDASNVAALANSMMEARLICSAVACSTN